MNYRVNICSALDRADTIDFQEGMLAYRRLNETCRWYSVRYGVRLCDIIGAFSALSPNNDYMGNLRSLVTLLDGLKDGSLVESLTVSTYNACRQRAWRCLHGEDFLSFTKGPKTRSFYQNILYPYDRTPVTIDGHMVSVAFGRRMTMKEVVREQWNYEGIAQAFRGVADDNAMLPNQLQATLWFTWKRIHNVVYNPQLDVFNEGNQWRYVVNPSEVLPYPAKSDAPAVLIDPWASEQLVLDDPFYP